MTLKTSGPSTVSPLVGSPATSPPNQARSDEALVADSPVADACEEFHDDPAKIAAVRVSMISPQAVEALADTFKVLGDVTRVRILDALSHHELCVCDLAALLGLTESAVSHQLRQLRGMRLVRPRRAGRMIFYSLDDQHIMSLFQQGLRHVEERHGR